MNMKRTKMPSLKAVASAVNCVMVGTDLLMLPEESSPAAVSRFDKFVRWTLRYCRAKLTPAHQVIACVLALDALTNPDDLLAFLHAAPKLVSRGAEIHVTWNLKDDIYRRDISAVSALAIKSLTDSEIDWAAELLTFSQSLPEIYPLTRNFRATDRLAHVLSDASAWLYLHLPNACFAYVFGKLKLTVLPESVYERRFAPRSPRACLTPAGIDVLAHAKDVACDISFGDTSSTSSSQWIILALKNLLSEHSNGDSIRTADHLAREVVRRRFENITNTLMRSGTPVDGLLLSWVIFLFESGSVRVRNPKLGTISRYVHAAAELILQTLRATSSAPADLDQDDWEALFKQMLQGDTSNECRCSLASFQNFLQSQFGIDPMPWLFNGAKEHATPNANYLWRDEVQSAFELIPYITSDPRLQQTIPVMLAIGTGGSVRAGEMRSLRVGDIKTGGGKLVVYLLPKRSHHQGKSRAARRTLDLTHSPQKLLIEVWQQRRRDESAEEDDLLFGDPHIPQRGYRLGTCQRLLNQVLRMATGDSLVSFHTLRHTVICDDLRDTLMNAAVHQSISPVHRIKVQAGHQHEWTTFLSYFHLPEKAIRFWIDKAVARHIDHPVVVASWLGASADTLRQNRHRTKNKCGYLAALLRDFAQRKVAGTTVPTVAPISCRSELTAVATREVTFNHFFCVLTDMEKGLGMAAICSRNATSEDKVIRVCRITADLVSRLESGAREKSSCLSGNANDQAALDHAGRAIRRVGCHFESAVEPHLVGLVHLLTSATLPNLNLRIAVHAWLNCKKGHVLSLTDAEAIKPLITLLAQAGVSPTNMLFRIQVDDPLDPVQSADALGRLDVSSALTALELSCSAAQIESVRTRRGRPDVYLLLSRNRLSNGKPGASASSRMNRFHALMLALAIWIEFDMTVVTGVDNEHCE